MRIKEKEYYRKFGMLAIERLTNPRLIPLVKLNLPTESIYQFFEDNGAVVGPSVGDPVLSRVLADGNPRLFIEHVTELTQKEGGPRRTVLQPNLMQADFKRKNRLLRPMRQDKALLINNRNVLIVNYNMLNPLYRYIASYKAGFFRWSNNASTFWSGVRDCHGRFDWNQYIDLALPGSLPKLSQFALMANSLSQETLKKFNTATVLNIFDIWQWLGEDRHASKLSVLGDEALNKINFIVRTKTHFVVINLGKLNAFRKNPDIQGDLGLAPKALQRKFYIFIQGLIEFNNNLIKLNAPDAEGDQYLDIRDPEDTAVAGTDGNLEQAHEPTTQQVDEDQEILAEESEPEKESGLPELDLGLVYEAPPEPVQVDSALELDDDDDFDEELTPEQDEALDATYVVEPEKASVNPMTQAIAAQAWELNELGILSGGSYMRALDDANTFQKLPDPFGSGKTIAESITYTQEDYALPEEEVFADKDTIVDKSMLKSKLKSIQRKYVSSLMNKDLLNAVMAVQQQGVSVKNYEIETVKDEMNNMQIHTVTLKPLRGRQSTVKFMIPVVDRDGRFVSNGTQYRMRLQRGDVPIRKVAPARVALTSYYNKTFVDRSERSINDFDKWLTRIISARGLDAEDSSITDVRYSSGYDHENKLPRTYSLLAKSFKQFTGNGITFYFDYPHRMQFFAEHGYDLEKLEVPATMYPIGFSEEHGLVFIDDNNTFYASKKGSVEEANVLGTITDLLDIDTSNAPTEAAVMSVSNKVLPVGFVLGYQFGLSKLFEVLGAEVSRHPRGARITTGPDDYTLVFQDEVVVLSKLDYRSTLVISGLNLYHRTLKRFSVYDFDKKDVYFRIMEDAKLGVRYLREIGSLFRGWMDPITKGLLGQMNEPTEFGALVIRACELLMTDYAPAEIDPAFMRYRGYERFSGVVYGELTRAIKTFYNRGGVEGAIEMRPHDTWQRIVQDPSVSLVEDSNPMANLREQEAMTYRGDGGRGGQSMVGKTRVYHANDLGTVSESTVDSGDVGVIAYLTPDANFIDMRGNTRPMIESDAKSKLFSSTALLSPCIDHDDTKRIGFASIQQQQGIYCDGAEVAPLRTGAEQIVGQRTTAMFCSAAEMDGEVVSVSKDVIRVRYSDGSEERFVLGKRHGVATGVVYPHEIVTDLKAGDTFKRSDTIAYNHKYFMKDRMCPGQVVLKTGVMANVALIDNVDTLEDGCAISERIAKLMNTQTTEPRVIQVGFEQAVHDLVKVGDHVDLDSILCTIEDPETADISIFGETSMDTLARLKRPTPRAKVVGVVSRIEVYYHGDFEDLSENLQQLARTADKERERVARALGTKAYTGEVDTSFRIRGKALDPDTLAIKVFIDHDMAMGVGDKGVFGNQMKTVVSRVYSGVHETAGKYKLPIDAIFGRQSIEARIVHSPVSLGLTNILLQQASFKIADIYFGDK